MNKAEIPAPVPTQKQSANTRPKLSWPTHCMKNSPVRPPESCKQRQHTRNPGTFSSRITSFANQNWPGIRGIKSNVTVRTPRSSRWTRISEGKARVIRPEDRAGPGRTVEHQSAEHQGQRDRGPGRFQEQQGRPDRRWSFGVGEDPVVQRGERGDPGGRGQPERAGPLADDQKRQIEQVEVRRSRI